MTHLTRGPISVEALVREVSGPERGGTCVFLGTVRDAPADGGVTGIEYTAYDAMADAELDRILTEAADHWPDARVALRHRLGLVETEEASIAIAAAAPHRTAAFEVCRYVIEQVKQRLPVWKKELRADGSTQWVDPDGHPSMVGPE
jgi:molybdopterin synthase catalytic subunit